MAVCMVRSTRSVTHGDKCVVTRCAGHWRATWESNMLDLASSGDWDSSVACIGGHKLQIGVWPACGSCHVSLSSHMKGSVMLCYTTPDIGVCGLKDSFEFK